MIESDSMPTIGHWALRIPTSSICKGNHIGSEACDNSEQGKMPRWGREKALWVPGVRFLNAANKCLDVATSNLAISYCYEGVVAPYGPMRHPAISARGISDSLQISQNAHHHRTAFSCQNTGFFQCEEGLGAEFLLFKIPNPTLATCYSEIRPGDPLHSEFFASFQGVTPFGCTFCNFFSRLRAKHLLGWQSDVVYVIIFFCLTFR